MFNLYKMTLAHTPEETGYLAHIIHQGFFPYSYLLLMGHSFITESGLLFTTLRSEDSH